MDQVTIPGDEYRELLRIKIRLLHLLAGEPHPEDRAALHRLIERETISRRVGYGKG